jgi:hypothetical protein
VRKTGTVGAFVGTVVRGGAGVADADVSLADGEGDVSTRVSTGPHASTAARARNRRRLTCRA